MRIFSNIIVIFIAITISSCKIYHFNSTSEENFPKKKICIQSRINNNIDKIFNYELKKYLDPKNIDKELHECSYLLISYIENDEMMMMDMSGAQIFKPTQTRIKYVLFEIQQSSYDLENIINNPTNIKFMATSNKYKPMMLDKIRIMKLKSDENKSYAVAFDEDVSRIKANNKLLFNETKSFKNSYISTPFSPLSEYQAMNDAKEQIAIKAAKEVYLLISMAFQSNFSNNNKKITEEPEDISNDI